MDTNYTAAAADILAAFDAGRDWPGAALCQVSVGEGDVVVAWRHGLRDGTGRLRFIRRMDGQKVYAEVDILWAMLRDSPAAALAIAHRQASWQMEKFLAGRCATGEAD